MSDLKLVSTEDLLDELGCRFDSHIFAGLRKHDSKSNADLVSWNGDLYTCVFLAQKLSTNLLTDHDGDCEPPGESI